MSNITTQDPQTLPEAHAKMIRALTDMGLRPPTGWESDPAAGRRWLAKVLKLVDLDSQQEVEQWISDAAFLLGLPLPRTAAALDFLMFGRSPQRQRPPMPPPPPPPRPKPPVRSR